MKFFLEIVAGPNAGSKYSLGEPPLTVGRNASANVACPENSFLSDMHCTLQSAPEGILLQDLNSANGTFVNGQRIHQARLKPGDLIAAGSLVMRIAVEAEARPAAPPVVASKTAAIFGHLATLNTPLYCLLDAACDQTIPSLIALAQERRQCLYDGQSAVELGDWAPYLVSLMPDAPFTKALLDLGWGKGWASYFTSPASFEDIRHHFRKFLMVQVQSGEELYFRFYDPRVLRDFLPTAGSGEAALFFGPVEQWFVESEDPAIVLHLRLRDGALATTSISIDLLMADVLQCEP